MVENVADASGVRIVPPKDGEDDGGDDAATRENDRMADSLAALQSPMREFGFRSSMGECAIIAIVSALPWCSMSM